MLFVHVTELKSMKLPRRRWMNKTIQPSESLDPWDQSLYATMLSKFEIHEILRCKKFVKIINDYPESITKQGHLIWDLLSHLFSLWYFTFYEAKVGKTGKDFRKQTHTVHHSCLSCKDDQTKIQNFHLLLWKRNVITTTKLC